MMTKREVLKLFNQYNVLLKEMYVKMMIERMLNVCLALRPRKPQKMKLYS